MNPIEELVGFEFALDQFIVLGIIVAAITKQKSFFKDWVPFLILWFTYDLMRSIADDHKHINVVPIYDLEHDLFGWMFGGEIPAFWAQNYQHWILSAVAAFYYTMHMVTPIIVGSVIYYKSDDREKFKEFSYAFLMTSYMALITFALYPVAPPWYIWNEGAGYNFDQPTELVGIPGSAAGLIEVDRLIGMPVFSKFYGRFNTNPYAALPSLHAAYAFISAFYTIEKYGWKRTWWIVIYPIGVMASAVYLNHHFVVDLILGIIYVVVSIKTVRSIKRYRAKRRTNKIANDLDLDSDEDNGKPPKEIKLEDARSEIEKEIMVEKE
ncbi:MAG: phosphatase PAP2 family protein [Candidatus Kariarchaeaceae archaeon]|jgi:membrane-associated phospholipid phosphatase